MKFIKNITNKKMKSNLNRNLSESNIHDLNQKYASLLNNSQNSLSINNDFPDTVKTLQRSIHEISQKIEEDKINLRILKERASFTRSKNQNREI